MNERLSFAGAGGSATLSVVEKYGGVSNEFYKRTIRAG